ncbi:hypothetical protein SLITK23_07400 [Streptomyces lividans]|uniref:hypothetical protein n=1 Tax=Streptomyces anthocyanicus TaxID=68174 RepID=UPI002DD8F591|nr:hypothetical protein [Streptomyces anthocyanicus]WSB65068.1 hypothetical protein OIE72_34555 [Streptomyces anthocyanicus]BDE37495.1 hypothetical protein SLITK23_07400 [Streptomyces lividans]
MRSRRGPLPAAVVLAAGVGATLWALVTGAPAPPRRRAEPVQRAGPRHRGRGGGGGDHRSGQGLVKPLVVGALLVGGNLVASRALVGGRQEGRRD